MSSKSEAKVFPAGGTLQSDVTSPLAVTNKKKNKATPDLAIARSKVFDVDILPTSSDVKTETRKPLPDKKVASAKKSVLETASTPSSSSSKQSKKTMTELVHEAIHAIKDRTGSSVPAITKYIMATYPDMEENNTFKSRLSQALKKGVASNHFNKIKCSYKISAEWAQKEKERKRKANAKKVAEKKKRNSMSEKQRNEAEAKRIEELANTLDPEELEKLKKQHTAKVERQKKKEEAERIAKERAERLRKRRFPMEDTRLHLEDKELNVSPPASVKRRPGVPYLFQVARDSKSTAMGPSRCDAMDHESRGLVPDMLQVYHFFRGDVGFNEVEGKKIVADFALKHLIYAILTAPGTSLGDHGHGEQLAKDLSCLNAALNPASWSEVCVMYMECMERYYTTPASLDSNVLAPGVTDVNYLFRFTNSPDLIRSNRVPGGYFGYRKSTLAKAFDKLNKQDPWTLSAEELMALLRSLTDDILASRPDIMLDMTEREEEMAKLLRTKRSADANYRKVKLAFEGPSQKKPSQKKIDNDKKNEEEMKEDGESKDINESSEPDKGWKRTASRRQFEQAKRHQEEACRAYEEGLKNLVARTEPIGHDRYHNRYYSFCHDPDAIYIEINRSPTGLAEDLPEEVQMLRTSWHVIDKGSLLAQFAASLDTRGVRENNLREELTGNGDNHGLQRFLFDDIKEEEVKIARKKKRQELEEMLEDARIEVMREEEGTVRRSGRFETGAQGQVAKIESEIADLDKKIKADEIRKEPDYIELTGIETLRKFDAKRMARSTRRSQKKHISSDIAIQRSMPCTNLIPTGDVDGTGLVGWIVEELLDVEQLCQDLVPWEEISPGDRKKWIQDLEHLASAWNEACPQFVGPEIRGSSSHDDIAIAGPPSGRASIGSAVPSGPPKRHPLESVTEEGSKRRKLDMASPVSVASSANQLVNLQHIVSQLKKPLLELEERIYQVSGLAMADRDQNVADDNMSAAEEDSAEREKHKIHMAWRKKVHFIRSIPAKRPSYIREALIEAIAAARKASLGNVVAHLRSALLLYHPEAAGDCKQAAIQVLEENGGYDPDEDDDEDEEEDDEDDELNGEDNHRPSNLCFEAMALLGSLGDDENATRRDWTESVKDCKTISRFAALSTAFVRKATTRLKKLLSEREALEKAVEKWQKGRDRHKQYVKNIAVSQEQTEMWANVHYTDNFCMVQLDDHPWWPAKKCVAKDQRLEAKLRSFGRQLVALVGEHGELRCVPCDNIKEFTGKAIEEDMQSFTKEDRAQLEDCVAVARRIVRGTSSKPSAATGATDGIFVEEKKHDK